MRSAANMFLVLVVLAGFGGMILLSAQPALDGQAPEPTTKRLREKGWWPTRTDAARKDYAGTEACAGCHQQKVLEQTQTPMAHAASRVLETELLRSNPKISLTLPPFQTVISRDRKGSTYTVARGGEAISGQLLWSMGQGAMGQTFILESGGALFESQLTYFSSIVGLDLTPGHTPAAPKDLERAFGERQGEETAQRCFGCHTTASSVKRQFDPTHASPGITCEACHGPGAQHVEAMQNKQPNKVQDTILDPGSFSPVQLVDFCGACHRAPQDVITAKDYVPINVRFQPYRLSKSRCWSHPDPRISCIACHNPHESLVREATFYDAKCLACHASTHAPTPIDKSSDSRGLPAANTPPACPVSTSHCVSCHMPQYKVPQMHGSFTDHDIRIVRPGDPYPL
jgi:hypothetical protein